MPQNYICNEVKNRLNLKTMWYHSVQNVLSSCLIFVYLKNCNFIYFVWV